MNTKRYNNFMPNNEPKNVRCYDNGGETGDRYTVVYTGRYRSQTGGEFVYRGMSENPFHPQGIGQYGSSQNQIDVNAWGFAPAMGRKNHLGRRVAFSQLPDDCRKLVIRDYKELWSLNTERKAA